MGWLRIVFTLLIFLVVTGVIYRKRHWIDKKLQKTWAVLILLLLSIASFLAISILLEFLFDEPPLNWEKMLRIYGIFSQTSSADSPPNASATDYVYNILLSVIGAFLFAGLLISTFNNVLTQRIEMTQNGLVNYDFSNHIAIIGANESLLTIILTITKNKNTKNSKILIVTSKSLDELSTIKNIVGTDIWDNIYYMKADILNPVEKNTNYDQHFLKRANITNCKQIYVLSDSTVVECDVDNMRILSSIYYYAKEIKPDLTAKRINCYVIYSGLAMIIKVCRSLENICIGNHPLHKSIRVIPFDFNMMIAGKAFSNINSSTIDVIGLSGLGVAVIKYALLACHYKNKTTNIKVYFTPEEIGIKKLFELSYDYKSVTDVKLNFIELKDYVDYVDLNHKAEVVILCDTNFDKNIKITYGLQRQPNHQTISVYSSTPVLSGVFNNNKGENDGKIRPFGNLNQSLDLDQMFKATVLLYKLYKGVVPNEQITDDIYFESGFDTLKWRLHTLTLEVFKKNPCTKNVVFHQQKAAIILAGYKIGEKTNHCSFIVCESDIDDFMPIIEEADKYRTNPS